MNPTSVLASALLLAMTPYSANAQCPSFVTFELSGSCTPQGVKDAAGCDLATALEISEAELDDEIEFICEEAVYENTFNFSDVTTQSGNPRNFQWDNNYFDGGTEWNREATLTADAGSIMRSFSDRSNSII